MKNRFIGICFCIMMTWSCICGQGKSIAQSQKNVRKSHAIKSVHQDTVSDFIDLLNRLAQNSDDEYFKRHCTSIIAVIEAKKNLSGMDSSFVEQMVAAFSDSTVSWNASELSSYLERKRPLIVSWTSPTDGVVSLAWLILPENWIPEQTYPLYVRLHGLWNVYDDPVEYMAYYLTPESIVETTFEDGYSFLPWGRGNLWYEGIGETDIWEGMDALEAMVSIDPERKYLTGFSMGGYGAWAIGQKSPEIWAALGIYAGALWYDNQKLLNATVAQRLKDVPIYFVCGTSDGLLSFNQTAYQMLQDAGNPDLAFVTFNGGHESRLENWQDMFDWMRNFNKESPSMVDMNSHEDPTQFNLFNNYPNPFNAVTRISYTIPKKAFVRLTVYDVNGRQVLELVNEEQNPGKHDAAFDASNQPSGMYFCRLRAGAFSSVNKMMVLK